MRPDVSLFSARSSARPVSTGRFLPHLRWSRCFAGRTDCAVALKTPSGPETVTDPSGSTLTTCRAGRLGENFANFWRYRSRLYRNQNLQVNIRWKALDEIYKICMLLHRSDLNISENFRQTFSHFSAFPCKNSFLSSIFH